MNIVEITEMLKRMPDAALAQTKSPDVPSWMLASEIGRRNRLREGAKAGTGAPPTVAEQLMQQISQQQPTPTQIPQPGAPSQPRGLGSMMAQGAPKGYAGGGIVAFGGGGEVRGYGEGGYVNKARRLGYKAKDEADAYAWLQQQRQLQNPYDPYAPSVTAPSLPVGEQVPRVVPEEAFPAGIPMAPSAVDVQRMTGRPSTPQIPPAQDPARLKLKAQQEAAARAAAAEKLPPAPAPAPSAGLGQLRAEQIAMPEKPTLAADVNIPARSGDLAKYYGEDEYGKALAADLAERRKQAAAAREKDLGLALIEGGLAGMAEASKSGATFFGSVAAGGLKALEGQKAREATRSEEEKTLRKEELGEVGRKQTEKRGYVTAALGEAKDAAKENREALTKYADRVQDTTFKNAELKNAINGYLIQASTQLKSHELALDRADAQQIAADRRAMGQLVTLAQKDMTAAVGTSDYPVVKKAYEELFSAYKSMMATELPPGAKQGKVVTDLMQ